jgi:class 3 adenylate cyclase
MWQLVINGPGYFDTAYDLREGVTHVGRADENDIVLSGDLVSRKHARFHVRADGLVLEDLGSRNGIKLNGEVATGHTPLKATDVVSVGENTLAVRRARQAEALETEMVDTGANGQVHRFGRGVDIREAVLMARDIRESVVLKALDNFVPFERSGPPVRRPSDTDEEPHTAETSLPPDDTDERSRVAYESLLLLYRVSEALARAKDLKGFLEETADLVMKRVGATTGVVLLRHRTGVMVPSAVRHLKKLQRGEVPVSDAIIDAALAQGQAIAVSDVRDDARFADRESVVLYGVDQVLCIPIGRTSPFLGVLYLNRTSGSHETVEALLDVCTAITQLLQTGIERFASTTPQPDEKARRALERFYPPEVVERRLTEVRMNGAKLAQLDERVVTVVHAELVGAVPTKPAVLEPVLAEFQRLCAQLFFSFEGTLGGFVEANSVRALFGAPYQRGDDGIRAVRAAMALKAEWEGVASRFAPKERLSLRVGLNTGKVVAGTIGTELRLDYVVIGDTPHLAGLLAASADGGQVLVTAKTLGAIGARFDVTPLGERALSGSRVRTAVFEVLDEDSDQGTLSGIR